jgi:hypothetical protein
MMAKPYTLVGLQARIRQIDREIEFREERDDGRVRRTRGLANVDRKLNALREEVGSSVIIGLEDVERKLNDLREERDSAEELLQEMQRRQSTET